MLLENTSNFLSTTYNYSDSITYDESCTYILNNDYNLSSNTINYSILEEMSQDEDDKELNALRKKIIYPELLEDWSSYNIMKWITDLYITEGLNYESINLHLLKDSCGSELVNFQLDTFNKIDSRRGIWLFNKFQDLIQNSAYSELYKQRGPQILNIKTDPSTDDVNNQLIKHRKRGRPRTTNRIRRKSEHKTGKLWEFIRDMLHNPEYCPSIIRWENHDEGSFKFISSDKVAKIWGSKRGNDCMNYEKLSRAMRYYYRGNILQPVLGKRLVYKFGPNAKEWRTKNPNFENRI